MTTKRLTVALIDADTIAYRASANSELREVQVTHKSNVVKVFKNVTEFKNLLESKGKLDTIDEYVVEPKQTPEHFTYCKKTIDGMIRAILTNLNPDIQVFCLSSKNNFRDSLPLPRAYKGNRKSTVRPIHLNAAKKYIRRRYGALILDGYEADDYLSILGYEFYNRGYKSIICSNDKDTLQASGLSMYNYTTDKNFIKDIPALPNVGYLQMIDNKVTGWGFKFLAYQTLAGDPVDNYKPYELGKIKFSPVKAFNYLNEASSIQEVSVLVLKAYQNMYPEAMDYTDHKGVLHKGKDWKYFLNLYFQCSYMKQRKYDYTTGISFYEGYSSAK